MDARQSVDVCAALPKPDRAAAMHGFKHTRVFPSRYAPPMSTCVAHSALSDALQQQAGERSARCAMPRLTLNQGDIVLPVVADLVAID